MRGRGPFVFAQVVRSVGVDEIVAHILSAWRSCAKATHETPD
jgi:hypothetical protein